MWICPFKCHWMAVYRVILYYFLFAIAFNPDAKHCFNVNVLLLNQSHGLIRNGWFNPFTVHWVCDWWNAVRGRGLRGNTCLPASGESKSWIEELAKKTPQHRCVCWTTLDLVAPLRGNLSFFTEIPLWVYISWMSTQRTEVGSWLWREGLQFGLCSLQKLTEMKSLPALTSVN